MVVLKIESRHGRIWRLIQSADTDAGRDIAFAMDLTLTIVDDFAAEARKIREDRLLSDAGKAEKLEALHAEFVERLERQARQLKNAEHAARQLQERAEKSAWTVEPHEYALGAEIRAYVRALKPGQRVGLIQQAQREGDLATLRALAMAPVYLSGIEPAQRDEIRRAVVRIAEPELAAQVDEVEEARTLAEAHFVQVKDALADIARPGYAAPPTLQYDQGPTLEDLGLRAVN